MAKASAGLGLWDAWGGRMHTRTKVVVLVLGMSLGAGAAPVKKVAMKAAAAETKPVADEAWTAKWIEARGSTERDGAELDGSRPMPVFRRGFVLKKRPVEARLRIAGLGQYDAWVNGEPVGHSGLHQAWTDYKKTVTYDSYSIKDLKAGNNALGVMLGNGMYNVQKTQGRYTKFEGSFGAPRLIAELWVKYADGKSDVIGTDAGWKCARGPVTFSSTYGGEDFDARKVDAGWDKAGFKDSGWEAATVVDGPGGKMTQAIAPDVRVVHTFATAKMTELGPGKVVYDLGQNFAGWPRVRVTGPAGAVLKLTPGELLKPDGTGMGGVTQASSGAPMWWTYTLRGDAKGEEWAPQFGYYGFRYVQAEWSGAAGGKITAMTGEELSSDSPVTGSFETSDEMLNAIHTMTVYAMHNNEVSIFTDCPHREKLGWLEETHLVGPGLMFNNDLRGLYAATEKNIADDQSTDGRVWTIAPRYTAFGGAKANAFDDSPEWGSASVLGSWAAYRFYGDKAELERDYPAMRAYLLYLASRVGPDWIVSYGLGDWYDIGPKPPGVSQNTSLGVTGTLMLYEDALTMVKVSALLGHGDEAGVYAAIAEHAKDGFNKRYWNAEKGWYDRGSQTANAMPLALGIVPQERRAQVLAHVVADIEAHDEHITTGEVGYPYLLRVLASEGRNDLVLAMMEKKDPPSYGSQIAAGATALTEAWDGNPHSSQDHFMLGGAEEWFYRGLAGIDFDMSRGTDERITIRPAMVAGLGSVKASYKSVLGTILSEWEQSEGTASIDIGVPPGATATLILPVKMVADISGIHAVKGKGPELREVRRDGEVVVYWAAGGLYHFREAESGK
jgi:alpha-L-rhamnosidase